ncbi:hypothetical protein Taro_013292 [Colocasia esculenta]|uniref:tRNA-uridine aminocarboxypropyltransferase n=1 Tax=Colocasia esculenta TaxID=4460 RepID=A0A843ULQ3_COLES|nr:hypothetical protein [Colocasia esculenta]
MFSAAARPAACRCFLGIPGSTRRKMDCPAGARSAHGPSTYTVALPYGEEEASASASAGGWRGEAVSLREWQGWGSSSPVPAMVTKVVDDLMALERETDAEMTFGGLGGKLQGDFKVQEDKKHRAVYQSLVDSETKLQFFAARQIACRLLGSRSYLCQKVFINDDLPSWECPFTSLSFCSAGSQQKIVCVPSSCHALCGVEYIFGYTCIQRNSCRRHSMLQDFLRQNNTGKLLWQVYGIQSASLCLFGILEQEEIMWDAFKHAGKDLVWFLYPDKSKTTMSVQDILLQNPMENPKDQLHQECDKKILNFVLIDGTWSNSSAMYKRLKEHARLLWGGDDLPCISLSSLGVSVMHKLRPQPAWDRTCTAAAAIGLLSELHLRPELSSYGLDKQAEALDNALDVLLDSLTKRRLRLGRSITRKERNYLF